MRTEPRHVAAWQLLRDEAESWAAHAGTGAVRRDQGALTIVLDYIDSTAGHKDRAWLETAREAADYAMHARRWRMWGGYLTVLVLAIAAALLGTLAEAEFGSTFAKVALAAAWGVISCAIGETFIRVESERAARWRKQFTVLRAMIDEGPKRA